MELTLVILLGIVVVLLGTSLAVSLSGYGRPQGKHAIQKKEAPKKTSVVEKELDPENPPRVMTYNGPPGTYKCQCCNEFLEPKQDVVWWPVPKSEEVQLYCLDKVEIEAPGE